MSESVRQLGWTEIQRHGIRWSKGKYWKRFSIVRTATGFTVTDHQLGDLARTTTFALAKAWVYGTVLKRRAPHGEHA